MITIAWKANPYLGTELSRLEIETIFIRLGFRFETTADEEFKVDVPTRRGDISLDVDLIEEIARLYGYDNIPTTPIHGNTIAWRADRATSDPPRAAQPPDGCRAG